MKQMNVEAIVENIDPVTQFVSEELEAHGCGDRPLLQIAVAIDEIFGNIAHYAYAGKKGGATVQVSVKDGVAEITFIDEGVPFNPLKSEDPDVSLSAEERGIGGLGIYLVKKTMDSLEYERRDGRNILKLTKRI